MERELYSEIILDLYKNPPNKGRIENYSLEAGGGNPVCGDHVTFTLKIRDGKVADIKFFSSGCAISIASQALLSEMVKGKSVKSAAKINAQQLFEQLGNIIQTRQKCALLGLLVLQEGFARYEKNRKKKTSVKGIVV